MRAQWTWVRPIPEALDLAKAGPVNMNQQFSGSQILVIFALFWAKIFQPSDERGSAQKGAKITKA
jgi:hypothetical protein